MTISEIKTIITEFKNIDLDTDDVREFITSIQYEETDFEINGYRFIHTDEIDDIQKEELSSDEYILGCFTASFIAETCDIDIDVVEALQKAEAFDALGGLMLKNGIDELQTEYARLDGYGHHFNHYDGNEYEIGDFYVFRVD